MNLVYIEIDSTIQLVVENWDGSRGRVVNGNWELIKSEFTHQYRSDNNKWKAYKTFEVTKVPSWLRNEDYNEIIEKMVEYKNEINSETNNQETGKKMMNKKIEPAENQYVVYYKPGSTMIPAKYAKELDIKIGRLESIEVGNATIANKLIEQLQKGHSLAVPLGSFKIQKL